MNQKVALKFFGDYQGFGPEVTKAIEGAEL